jgi:para-aminobenzoate synthetase / 4-amino-4-deoxychorismate lyase
MSPFSLLENTFDPDGTSSYYTEPVCEIKATQAREIPKAFTALDTCHTEGLYLVGYMSYELGYVLYPQLNHLLKNQNDAVLLHFIAYKNKQDIPHTQLESILSNPNHGTQQIDLLCFKQSYQDYKTALKKVNKKLINGESYQINYTSQYTFEYPGSPLELYFSLRKQQLARFCAYLPFAPTTVISFSPELFFKKSKYHLTVKPMKGTYPRSDDPAQDLKNRQALLKDKKVQSENLIIVDLLRNDLSKIAQTGTVKVKRLFEAETYKTLYQMTSTIEAECPESLSFKSIIKALFPCGSITGAPKLRTMKAIHSIENQPRGIYTGAIGSIQPNGDLCFSVAIRTIALKDKQATLGVGAGITIESNTEEEWHEMHLKAKYLRTLYQPSFEIIEALHYQKQQGFTRLQEHLSRLHNTVDTLAFQAHGLHPKTKLQQYVHKHIENDQCYKIRIAVGYHGNISITHTCIPDKIDKIQPINFTLCSHCIDKNNILFQYKTTSKSTRKFMDENFVMTKKRLPNIDTLLFKNQDQNLTETLYHNLILEIKGVAYTPPVLDGLLPGVYRSQLLNNKKVIEKSLKLSDLQQAEKIWLCNDVRGLVPAIYIEENL